MISTDVIAYTSVEMSLLMSTILMVAIEDLSVWINAVAFTSIVVSVIVQGCLGVGLVYHLQLIDSLGWVCYGTWIIINLALCIVLLCRYDLTTIQIAIVIVVSILLLVACVPCAQKIASAIFIFSSLPNSND